MTQCKKQKSKWNTACIQVCPSGCLGAWAGGVLEGQSVSQPAPALFHMKDHGYWKRTGKEAGGSRPTVLFRCMKLSANCWNNSSQQCSYLEGLQRENGSRGREYTVAAVWWKTPCWCQGSQVSVETTQYNSESNNHWLQPYYQPWPKYIRPTATLSGTISRRGVVKERNPMTHKV